MENEEKKGKGIYYDHTIISDKYFFGGYLNLAQNNINAVLSEFSERFSLTKMETENKEHFFKKYFPEKISPSNYQERIDFLKQFFPVVHYLDLHVTDDRFIDIDNDKKDVERRLYFLKHFRLLLKSIDDLRDFYTHYYHVPLTFTEEIFTLVDDIFLSVVQEVKKHKMKDDKTRHLLKKELNNELTLLEKAKAKEIKLKQYNTNGEKIYLDKDSIKNAVLNDAFYHLLYKNDEVSRNYKSRYVSQNSAENLCKTKGIQ